MRGEAKWVRGNLDCERLPVEIANQMNDAVVKMAAIYGWDLKEKPRRRIMAYEAIAALVDAMSPNDIRNVIEHGRVAIRRELYR
jgi:hypothetical protein